MLQETLLLFFSDEIWNVINGSWNLKAFENRLVECEWKWCEFPVKSGEISIQSTQKTDFFHTVLFQMCQEIGISHISF